MTRPNLNLGMLTERQKRQVIRQWKVLQHKDFSADFPITPNGDIIRNFYVKKGVWNPFVTSARWHASYLFHNNERLYTNRYVLDVGTGTGLMGIVMAMQGAGFSVMSDISRVATDNARENIKRLKLEKNARAIRGDLFENTPFPKYDCIVFNHPFFAGNPPQGDTIAASMLAPPSLLRRFLEEAPDHLQEGGVLVMPYFNLAPEVNDPAIVGKEKGYNVQKVFSTRTRTGVQIGEICIYELRRR